MHAEYFQDIDELAREKSVLVQRLPKNGLAIMNADDERVMEMRSKVPCEIVTYGLRSTDVSMENVKIASRVDEHFDPDEQLAQTTADVSVGGASIGALNLKDVIGYAPALSCLAAIAVARRFDIDPTTAIERLNNGFHAVPGRLRPLAGIKGSMVIDDSYNAAPAAMRAGLDVLKAFVPGEDRDRRIAALGSMAELGQYSANEHRMIGMKVAESADVFVAVGEAMQEAVNAAKEAGMDAEHIHWFPNSEEAGRFLDPYIQEGDIVYVKGSQSSRMEKVVKDIMAEPMRAEELLVRQEKKWQSS